RALRGWPERAHAGPPSHPAGATAAPTRPAADACQRGAAGGPGGACRSLPPDRACQRAAGAQQSADHDGGAMNATATQRDPVAFSPALTAEDSEANRWMREATLRLRRETCWRWHLNAKVGGDQMADRLVESLDLTRYRDEKLAFFESDVAARYLSEQLRVTPWRDERELRRGGFGWAAKELQLDALSRFVLGLALLAGFDGAAGPVIAGCLNDATRTQPTLALAQRLWDRPEEALALADPSHALWRLGLLQHPTQ